MIYQGSLQSMNWSSRLSRPSRSFIQAYQPGRFLVINAGLRTEGELGSTRVRWLHPIDLPDSLRQL